MNGYRRCGVYIYTQWSVTQPRKELNLAIYNNMDGPRGYYGLPCWLSGKEPACQCKSRRFNPCVSKIPWRWKWQPVSVFWPGKSHGQRILVGYNPWGCKRVVHDVATKQQQESIMLREMSDKDRQILYNFTYLSNIKKNKIHKQTYQNRNSNRYREQTSCYQRGEGWEEKIGDGN